MATDTHTSSATPEPIRFDAQGNLINPYGKTVADLLKEGGVFAASTMLPGGQFAGSGGAGAGAAGAAGTGGGMGLLNTINSGAGLASTVFGLAGALHDPLGHASAAGQTANQNRDLIKLALERNNLARSEFATVAPGTRLKTALQAALAQGAGPSKVTWGGPGSGLRGEVPSFSGLSNVLTSLKNNSDFQSLSKLVGSDTLAQERSGGATGGNADAASSVSGIGDESAGDRILGGASLGTSILGALGKLPRALPNPGPANPYPWEAPGYFGSDWQDPNTPAWDSGVS